jgi:hypothetical protein
MNAMEVQSVLRMPIEAHLSLAGAETSPKDEIAIMPRGQIAYWSIKATDTGVLNGWVAITNQKDSSDVQVIANSDQRKFSVKVSRNRPDPVYLFGVIGSIMGALLASLPAWLNWHKG